LLIYEDVGSLDNPWMIKRTFTSESYDHAFSEQTIKAPAFHQELITKLTSEQAQLFCSKHGLLLLGFINLIGILVLLIFMMSQFQDIHQRIDEDRSKVSKLDSLVKVLGNPSEKTKYQALSQEDIQPEPEPDLMGSDLNIKYLGLINDGNSFKALLGIDEVTNFFSKGQMVNGRWLIKSFDQSQMVLESIKGQQVTILLEQ
jgi:hypothetical protein